MLLKTLRDAKLSNISLDRRYTLAFAIRGSEERAKRAH
jgi:hypothetical protein